LFEFLLQRSDHVERVAVVAGQRAVGEVIRFGLSRVELAEMLQVLGLSRVGRRKAAHG
jgi:hypothetical protein